MAKARYLKSFWISWATPHVDFNPGEARGLSRGEVVIGINKKVQAFQPLTNMISARLRKEKRMLSPETTHARVHISNVESVNFAFYPFRKNEPLQIFVPCWMDPLDVLDVPNDAQAMGSLAIKIVEDFLEMVKVYQFAVSDFPFEVFESAIRDFKENEMKVRYRPVTREIIGTSVKAELCEYATPGETTVWITLKKGKNKLYTKQVASHRAGYTSHTPTFVDVTLANDAIEVNGLYFPSTGIHRIEFSELPPELVEFLKSEK